MVPRQMSHPLWFALTDFVDFSQWLKPGPNRSRTDKIKNKRKTKDFNNYVNRPFEHKIYEAVSKYYTP